MNRLNKVLAWIVVFMFLGLVFVLGGYQQYSGSWTAYMDQKAVQRAVQDCYDRGFNSTDDCVSDLIQKKVHREYESFIKSEAQGQLARIFSINNYTLILEANQTLSQIGN